MLDKIRAELNSVATPLSQYDRTSTLTLVMTKTALDGRILPIVVVNEDLVAPHLWSSPVEILSMVA